MKEIILKYARLGIYIEVLADCFTMNIDRSDPPEQQVCWRPCLNWFEDGQWHEDDAGCHPDIDLIMADAERMAERIYQTTYKGQPLDFENISPRKI